MIVKVKLNDNTLILYYKY